MDITVKALVDLLECMDGRNIQYVALGDIRNFPRIDTDFDIVVHDFGKFVSMLREYCDQYGYRLIRAYPHATGVRFDIVIDDKNFPPAILRGPDVQFFATWHIKRHVLQLGDMLGRRIRTTAGVYVPHPADAFIQYLVRRIDKNVLEQVHGLYLSRLWAEAGCEAEMALSELLNSTDRALVCRASESGDWRPVMDRLPQLREALSMRAVFDWQRLLWIAKRARERISHPSGLFVAFFGPDGSGKSTVIAGVRDALGEIFDRVSVTHLRPRTGIAHVHELQVVTDPHGMAPRGAVLSIVKLLYFCMDYFIGYWRNIWPARVCGRCVIFDRYFDDILVDPARYRFGAPLFLVRMFRRFVPDPECYILLDAPAEVLQSRKQEVTPEESSRQRQAYLALFARLQEGRVVNASGDVRTVQAAAAAQLFDYLARRTADRLEKTFAYDR